jgi:hypothetical protein
MSAVALPEELVDFLESGASMLVGTRDGALRPECLRAAGCIVDPDRSSLRVLMNAATAARTVANLEAGSPIAVTFSRPVDHRTVQVKGTCRRVRPADSNEHEVAERYLALFTEALYVVGMSRAMVRRMRVAPTVVAEIQVLELFHQTPGPGAGRRLEERDAAR